MTEDTFLDETEATDAAVEAAADNTEAEVVEKPDELLEEFQGWVADDVSEDDIVMKLHTDHGLSLASAVSRLRKLKKQAGLTAPRGNKSEEVQAFMKTRHEDGADRKTIIEEMVEKFGYTPKSAASTFSVQGKKMGLAGDGAVSARVPLEDTVKFLRANSDLAKKDLVEKMQEDLGYAASTCNAFYIYIPMAKEWAKQECAEQ